MRGPVAQLGARFHGMEEVVSSNLTRSTSHGLKVGGVRSLYAARTVSVTPTLF